MWSWWMLVVPCVVDEVLHLAVMCALYFCSSSDGLIKVLCSWDWNRSHNKDVTRRQIHIFAAGLIGVVGHRLP